MEGVGHLSSEIYRKVSLERLSSPEQLDSLLTVTSPRGWIALTAAGLLVMAAIVWGVFGSLPTKLNYPGILLKSGGIQRVVSGSGGQITDIRVVNDDFIQKGQVVARLAQPEMVDQINSARAQLSSLQNTPANDGTIKQLQLKINQLESQLETVSRVVSPVSGRIVEVKVSRGDFVNPGQTIVSLEATGEEIKDLEAVLYVRAEDAKKIEPGMAVNIALTSIKKEEFGLLLGRVTSVPKYPQSFAGMMKTLGNEELVKQLTGMGAPVEVHIDIIPDAATVSGYKWTTPSGPPVKLNSGTLINGSVIVKTQRPLSLIFPQFD
jgi:multidrug efflux pump subunit AcrA (membrane-fusion protein)